MGSHMIHYHASHARLSAFSQVKTDGPRDRRDGHSALKVCRSSFSPNQLRYFIVIYVVRSLRASLQCCLY